MSKTETKYKVGDIIKIKSLQDLIYATRDKCIFMGEMGKHIEKELKVIGISKYGYAVEENEFYWADWMIESGYTPEEEEEVVTIDICSGFKEAYEALDKMFPCAVDDDSRISYKGEQNLVTHMKKWRTEHHNVFKSGDMFWKMFFKEMEKQVEKDS